jgi:hypothetical protein
MNVPTLEKVEDVGGERMEASSGVVRATRTEAVNLEQQRNGTAEDQRQDMEATEDFARKKRTTDQRFLYGQVTGRAPNGNREYSRTSGKERRAPASCSFGR